MVSPAGWLLAAALLAAALLAWWRVRGGEGFRRVRRRLRRKAARRRVRRVRKAARRGLRKAARRGLRKGAAPPADAAAPPADAAATGGGGGGWRKARITCYAPTTRFAFGGTASDMVAVHEKDAGAFKNRRLEIRWPGGATKTLRVGDYCADKDCGGCCTKNADTGGGFLLDVNRASLPGGVAGDPCWAGGEFRVV